MTVAIIADSAAALPAVLVERHGIRVVPLHLTVDGVSYREGEQPPDALDGSHQVTTSGPAPAEWAAAVAEHHDHEGVVVLTLSGAMSSTYQAAVIGTEGLEVPVRVVDTRTAAGAEALVVLAAATAAEAGHGLEGVERAARQAVGEVRLTATLPSLDHLVRSGRVPEVAGTAGRWLGVAPLFEFRDGKAKPLRPALTRQAAIDRMLGRCRRDRREGARLHVAAMHAAAEHEATALLERVAAEVDPVTAFIGEFNAVMVTHTGPGLLGLAWRWERPEPAHPPAAVEVTEAGTRSRSQPTESSTTGSAAGQ